LVSEAKILTKLHHCFTGLITAIAQVKPVCQTGYLSNCFVKSMPFMAKWFAANFSQAGLSQL